jgi:hypothetical protein
MHTVFSLENLKERDYSEDLGVIGMDQCGLDASGSGQGPVTGSCEHGNEILGPTKCEEFLD